MNYLKSNNKTYTFLPTVLVQCSTGRLKYTRRFDANANANAANASHPHAGVVA